MPKTIIFNNRQIIEPGAYAQILGAVEKAPDVAAFGNVCIIDTGFSGETKYGFGSGINGEKDKGNKAIYEFTKLEDFQRAIGGGLWADVAKSLFNPSRNPRVKGCDKLIWISAKTSIAASKTLTFTGGGANGGSFKVKTRVEGLPGNGLEVSSVLKTGFAMKMIAGRVDTAKFIIQFYRGTFKGINTFATPDDTTYDGISEASAKPVLLAESIEFSNIATLITWAKNDPEFNSWFYDNTSTIAGTGVVDAADLAANTGNKLFAGATETYGSTDLDDVLKNIVELDNTFFLFDQWGADAQSTENTKIWAYILQKAEFEKFGIVGGGDDSDNFFAGDTASSLDTALYYDSERIFVCHSAVYKDKIVGTGLIQLPSIYFAAMTAGRMAGQQPQEPITWVDVDVKGVVHELNKEERETALKQGVIHLRKVTDLGLVINQDVNTLQSNSQDIFPNGSSPHGSLMRISAILNKELITNIRKTFIPKKNANTSSPADIKTFIEGYLQSRTANATTDNLILNFKNVVVDLIGSDYKISYAFTGNGPINRFFITGFSLPVNISA